MTTEMVTARKVSRVETPSGQPGFLGEGHTAVPVLDGHSFRQTDPFILLMDDQLDLPGTGTVGGPHPHAGFETVTLVLEGDPDNRSLPFQTGSIEWMTAGSGIVHTEEIDSQVKMRILQLWLTLPRDRRWTAPKWQELRLERVPVKKEGASEIRVYSGTSQGLTAPIINETPTTIVDFRLDAGVEAVQEFPAAYNAFLYVIAGSLEAGAESTPIGTGQIAWLDRPTYEGSSQIPFKAGEHGARFILYAGMPQGDPIVSHGPFIGDTREDIIRLYAAYRQGEMGHVNDLPEQLRIHH